MTNTNLTSEYVWKANSCEKILRDTCCSNKNIWSNCVFYYTNLDWAGVQILLTVQYTNLLIVSSLQFCVVYPFCKKTKHDLDKCDQMLTALQLYLSWSYWGWEEHFPSAESEWSVLNFQPFVLSVKGERCCRQCRFSCCTALCLWWEGMKISTIVFLFSIT